MLSKIKQDQLTARKAGDKIKASILTTLIGEASPVGNQVASNDEIIKVVNKFIKNIDESLKLRYDDVLVQERKILEVYLPPVFDKFDILDTITSIDKEQQTLAIIMKQCKANAVMQNKLFDGKLVRDTIITLIEKD